MKTFLLKIFFPFFFILLLSGFASNLHAQDACNNIGFKNNAATNTLSICQGDNSVIIYGPDAGNNVNYTWQVSTTNAANSFTQVSGSPKEQNYTLAFQYYNTPGTYYFRRDVGNGNCKGLSDVVILTVNALPTPNIVVSESAGNATNDAVSCSGSPVTLTASGGGTGATYQWEHGATTASTLVSPAVTGTANFLVTVITASGCSATKAQAIVVNELPNATLTVTDNSGNANDQTVCAGGTVTFTAGGGTSYSWVPNIGTNSTISIIPTATTDYKVTVRNANGCTLDIAQKVTVNPLPTLTTTGSLGQVCRSTVSQHTTLSYSASTNSPTSYSIDWNDAANSAGLTDQGNTVFSSNDGGGIINNILVPGNTQAGTFTGTLTLTNANGCTRTQAVSLTVNVNAAPTVTGVSTTALPICSGESLSIALTGLMPNLKQTIYYIIGGTNGTQSATVTSNGSGGASFPSIALGQANSGQFLTIVGITRDDVTPSCSYNPSTPDVKVTLPTISGVLTAPKLSRSPNDVRICTGQVFSISTIPGVGGGQNARDEYRYKTPTGDWTPWTSTPPVSFTSVKGEYFVEARRVDDESGCKLSGTEGINWTVYDQPTVSAPSITEQTVCLDGTPEQMSVTITGGIGNPVYEWYVNSANNNTSGSKITGATSANYTPPATALGTLYYYAKISQTGASCGPVPSAIAAVTVIPKPTAGTLTKNVVVDEVCPGTPVSATLTPGTGGGTSATDIAEYSYDATGVWVQYTPGVAIPTAGHTRVQIRTARRSPETGCVQSAYSIIDWDITPLPSAAIVVSENSGTAINDGALCAGASADLSISGGVSYEWSTGATTPSISVTPSAASTTYQVSVTDAKGCTSVFTRAITVSAIPSPKITSAESSGTTPNDGAICAGASTTLTVDGGTVYHWSTNQTGSSISVTPTATTEYSVLVDNAGCGSTVKYTVNVNALPTPAIAVVETSGTPNDGTVCAGTQVSLTANGGTSYVWTPGNTNTNAISVTPGITTTYTVKATDDNGCFASVPQIITVNPLPTITTAATPALVTAICTGTTEQTTSLPYTATANNPNSYSIDWDNTANSAGLTDQASTPFVSVPGAGSVPGITVPANTPPGTYAGVMTLATASGCTVTKAISFVINPNNTITLSSAAATEAQTKCINTAITAITYTTTRATGATFSGLPAGVNGNWASNAVTISGTPTASGTFTYTITLTGGCGNITKTGTIIVTPNNTVTAASATPTVCINTALTAITHTTTGATGIGAATGLPAGVTAAWAGNTITISGTPTVSGTFNYSIPLTGGCGTVNASGTIIVTPNNTVTAASATPTVCINTALTAITHTTTGATGIGAATGLPAGVTAAWAGNTITISGTPTVSGTFNYSIPLTGGCGTVNASGTITVSAVTVGGTVTPAVSTACPGASNTQLTLAGHTGTIVRWESSTNGGATWTQITNTSATPTFAPPATTLYRAIVKSGACGELASSHAVVSVVPPYAPTATSNPPVICLGESVTLNGSGGLPFGTGAIDGTFNQANPAGWRIFENGTEIKFPADANNAATFPWSETNGPKTPLNSGITYDNKQTDGKFAIASGSVLTTMETPVFSTIGMTSAALEFFQAMVLTAGASGKIEISTDGGLTYPKTLVQYTGPHTIGNPLNNWAKLNLDLSDYLGLTNLRIKFTFDGAINSNWALDGFKIPGPPPVVTYQWSPTADLSPAAGESITATPKTTGTHTYTLTTTVNGCPGGKQDVMVSVNPLPTATVSVSAQEVCQNGPAPTITFTGANGTAPYTFTYKINGGANQQVTTTSGNSVTITPSVNNAGQFVYSLVSVVDRSATRCSQLQNGAVTLTVNPLPTATIAGSSVVCQNGPQPSVTFTGATGKAPYIFTYTVSNGTTTSTQTVTSSGNIATVSQSTATAGTFTYTLVSVRDASSTSCLNTVSGQTATITVNPVTLITGQPTGTTSYCVNGTPTALSVAATGTGLTYQWFSNGTNNSNTGGTAISGATNASFAPPTADEGTVYYYVVVTGACGVVPSNPIPVTVTPPLELTELSPLPKQCYGTKVTLTISVRNRNAQTQFQWYKNGQPISGATDVSFVINSITPANDGNYHVVVTGGAPCNTVLTSQAIPVSSYVQDFTEWTSSQETGIDPIEWHEEKNWTCGIPNLYRDALVPIVPNNKYPYVDNAPDTGGKVRNLVIAAGGPNLKIDGILKIAGNVTNNGKIDAYLNGINSTGTIEFVSNLNYYGTTGGYPGNGNNATALTLSGAAGEHDTRTQHLKISNLASFNIPVDVYGQLSFAGSNRNLNTGDLLTLKSVSSTVSAMVTDRTNNNTVTNNTITGKATVERFIDGGLGRGWRLLTAPITGITFKEAWQENRLWNGATSDNQSPGFGTLITGQQQGSAATANANGYDFWPEIANSAASIRYYAGAAVWTFARWVPMAHLNWRPFGKTEAYLLFVRGDRGVTTGSGTTILRPKGLLKEDLAHPVTVMAGQSHTLIGNPYASPLNYRKIYKANSSIVEPFFWVNNTALGDVGGYTVIRPKTADVDGPYEAVPEATTSGSTVPPVVSSGEGFFVVPKSGVTLPATITIGQTHKDVVKSEYQVFRLPGRGPAKLFANALEVRNNGEAHLLDGVLAEFDEKPVRNISKVTNSGENLAVVEKGTDWIVTAGKLPKVGDTVQLRFWNTSAKSYRFRFRSENFSIQGIAATLVDKFENKETPLAMGDAVTAYDFTITNNAASKDPFRFYIVFQVAPLPVAVLDAAETRGGVQLQWSVPEDLTVTRYELERSTDGNTFTVISQTPSRGSAAAQQYGHLDKQPAMVASYRVKLTGVTGKVGYSNTVTVELKQASGLTIYPNPVLGNTTSLQFTAKPQGRYTIVVYAPTGQQVASQVVEHSGGTASYAIPVGSLASGSYTMEVWHPDNRKEKIRLVVTH
jgi:hypothetical protein